MDIHRIIRDLNEEREHLDRVIAALELVTKTGGGYNKFPGRRGRKFMDVAGREEVSIRMKKYWAGRRAQAGFPVENQPHPAYTN
jgi:hypothetical protein